MTEIEELELKINTSEQSYRAAVSRGNGLWVPLVISVGLLIYMSMKISLAQIYLWMAGLCLLYAGLNVWRIYRTGEQKKQIENELNQYRSQLAELQAGSTEPGGDQAASEPFSVEV